ncbi:putative disease resistance protein RGA3 [Malania oleifera]|uniref:putative disease resistance protein RGA3 n=1 Tax=Malania oleifera TaxID=397392 RepID=UPI0025AE8F46|nr:putative disease resistance protein RGA3 [Malania oleifera]
MAESFVSNIAEKVWSMLSSIAVEEVSLALNAKSELKKLENTVSAIKALLLDAEEQQERNKHLREWLRKLKDACYDADNVLDEFEIESLRRRVVNRGSIERKVCNFFSTSNPLAFAHKMGTKIKDIRLRLDEIAADKAKFNLIERPLDMRPVHRKRELTHSFERPSNIIGRNGDKENIMQLLMSSRDHENVSIIPIVGIGGVGKTSLAKLVYNDERVARSFQLRMWVCVSEDFDLKVVIEKIIKSATIANCADLDMDQLQARLREILDDRKYLLILDDVWNESYAKWLEVKNLLMDGAKGSRIIVTTRSHSVASIMGTVPSYHLGILPHEDCVSLFVKWAFGGKQPKQYPNLLEIGNEIVKKCRGVPLALKTLGSLLYTKLDERDWLFVRDNEIWKIEQKEDDILPVLKLSYDQLPSYLKQCFAYCAILPKDCLINSDLLIQLWMAQGLIYSPDRDHELEDTGFRYFKELLSRSFFQDVEDYGHTFTCKMHDLVHDLAVTVALADQCCTVNSKTQSISKEVRHVSFSNYDWCKKGVPSSLFELKNLRTIYFQFYNKGPNKSFIHMCISRFKCLRVLDITDSHYEGLPTTIGDLKHLRYLDVSGNCLIRTLPNSVCKLQSLQTLLLFRCEELEELPQDIGKLISMRFLTITTKQTCFSEKGLGSLNSLRALNLSKCPNLVSLCEGMRHLTALRTLTITDCKNLTSLDVKYLTLLEKLVIYYCPKLNLLSEEEDGIPGPRSLQVLLIRELPLFVTLPQWLLPRASTSTANTLQYLSISGCPNLTRLPKWLGNLTSLQKLEILRCPKLLSLPETMDHLTALRLLRIKSCPTLSGRCERDTGEDWHKIAHIPEIYIT